MKPRSVTAGALGFAIATRADEPDLRRLLRENPMGGWISLSLEREPDYFAAAAVEGRVHQTMIAREVASGEAVGLFSRSVRNAYINGAVGRLGYIGQLRVARGYRHKIRRLRQGFEALRGLLHDPNETPFYLTSIVDGNHAARRVLSANLPAMPTYRERDVFCTFAVVPAVRYARYARAIPVQAAADSDLPDIANCLQRNYARYQFAPYWSVEYLRDANRCPNLHPGDFFVARDGGHIRGCLALWDQMPFKQSVARGYTPTLARLRPAANLVAPFLGMPRPPPIGTALTQVYLSHIAADEDDAPTLRALIGAALAEAARREYTLATFGLAHYNPSYGAVQSAFRGTRYLSRLYTVCWEDGRAAVDSLDARVPHVEIATL